LHDLDQIVDRLQRRSRQDEAAADAEDERDERYESDDGLELPQQREPDLVGLPDLQNAAVEKPGRGELENRATVMRQRIRQALGTVAELLHVIGSPGLWRPDEQRVGAAADEADVELL